MPFNKVKKMDTDCEIEKIVVDKFLEKFFDFKNPVIEIFNEDEENEKILMDEKRKFLKNFVYNDKYIEMIVEDYLKFSKILKNNKYLKTFFDTSSSKTCKCFYNLYNCCINKLYKEFIDFDDNDDDIKFSFNLIETCCCNCCTSLEKEMENYNEILYYFLKNKNLTVDKINLKLKFISYFSQFKFKFLNINSISNFNCIKNSLECCISYLYDFFKNYSGQEFDENIKRYLCCCNIKKINIEIEEEEEEEKSLSFRLVEDDDEEEEAEERKQDSLPLIKKTAIKKNTSNLKTNTSTSYGVRKSVKFLDDMKIVAVNKICMNKF